MKSPNRFLIDINVLCIAGLCIFASQQSPSRLETSEQTTGRQLQRVLHYSMAPTRALPGLRRAECAIHDVDCDEVYPGIYIGDA
ncbi:GL15648 [Drosophila persimilis]|uniref:GL15648 n=1 Tax=Drosophila persimilis TaxID=7234 RepID=B4HD93_DROPE|nr:GL15648 [Drosophila persimilis]